MFLGGSGTIQGPVKGFCCAREGSFARATLGQFAAAFFASLFSWTFIEADLWQPKQCRREETVFAPPSLSPFQHNGLTLQNDLEKRRELFCRSLSLGFFYRQVSNWTSTLV
jgi:hypothetical protein